MDDVELCHYGVKGMKWGVRRAIHAKSVHAHKAQKQIDTNRKLAKYAEERVRSGRDSTNRRLTKDEINSYKKELDIYTKAAKDWMSARDDIMNMKVPDFTTKDVKRRFKDARSTAGGFYVY